MSRSWRPLETSSLLLAAIRIYARFAGHAVGARWSRNRIRGRVGLTRLMEGFLFRATVWDPAVFISIPILLTAVALFAMWLHALAPAPYWTVTYTVFAVCPPAVKTIGTTPGARSGGIKMLN
jgi:hypothetical protein